MKCNTCGRPRAWDNADAEFPLLPLIVGVFLVVGACFTLSLGTGLVGLALMLYAAWLLHHMVTTDYCRARPEWGEPCEKAHVLAEVDRKQYFHDIEQAQGQARYNQRKAWEERGEDPGWDRFKEEYPNFH
jgi:hypothetical protein